MLTAKQYLISLVNQQTDTYLGEIDVTFSEPTKQQDGGSRNTHIKVFPKMWLPFANGFDIYYNRTHVSRIRPFQILKGDAKTIYQVIDLINATQEFNFTTDDLIDAALPIANSFGIVTFKPQFKPTSLGFYDGPVVKTVTEYINPDAPVPPDPADPNDIPPAPSAPVAPGTFLRTECRGSEQWAYMSRFDLPPEWILNNPQSSYCNGYSVSPVTINYNVEAAETAYITYFFNKPVPTPVNFRVRAINSLGNATAIGALQYKAGNDNSWSLVNMTTGFTIPANTPFFSIMAVTRLETIDNVFIRLIEKGGDTALTNGATGVDIQLNISGNLQTPPSPYDPYGTLVTEFCTSGSNWGRYADGVGGTFEKLITLNDPDCGYVPKPTLTVDYPTANVLEDSEHVFTYTLSDNVFTPLGLRVTLVHLTTVASDVVGLDYQLAGASTWAPVPGSGNIAIPNSDLTFKIRVTTAEDALVEGNEYFQLKVAETASTTKLSNTGPLLSNITLIDLAPPPLNPTSVLSVTGSTVQVRETVPGVVRFNMSESTNYNVPLTFKAQHQTTNASDITAFHYRSGGLGDYIPIQHNETIYVLASALYLDIRITATQDLRTEGQEHFVIGLEEPVPNKYYANTEPVIKRINIVDDSLSPKPTMTTTNTTLQINEGASGIITYDLNFASVDPMVMILTATYGPNATATDIGLIEYRVGGGTWAPVTLGALIQVQEGHLHYEVRVTAATDTETELDETVTLKFAEQTPNKHLINGPISTAITIKNVV